MHVSRRLAERKRGVRAADHRPRTASRSSGRGSRPAAPSSVFRFARRGGAPLVNGELMRLDTDPAAAGRIGARPPVPARPGARHRAVQLPAQPGGAQGRARRSPSVRRSCSSPRPATPLSALVLGELLAETDLPAGHVRRSCPCHNDGAPTLVGTRGCRSSPSPARGRSAGRIRDAVPRKHVTLELGGNAAAVVCADYSSTPTSTGPRTRIATFGNYQAGQSCISVQRVLVDSSRLRPASCPSSSRRSRRRSPATRGTTPPTSARSSTRRAPSASCWVEEAVDGGRHAAHRRHAARVPPSRPRC